MPDYKAMYYHLAGRMATALEALDATTGALVTITEKLKLAQQATEEMFISSVDEEDEKQHRIAQRQPEIAPLRGYLFFYETEHDTISIDIYCKKAALKWAQKT